VIAFSTIDRESFVAVEKWKSKVEAECGELPMVLIQNKIDLHKDRSVENQEVDDIAKKLNLQLYKTCVADGTGVNEVFTKLAEEYLKKNEGNLDKSKEPKEGFTLDQTDKPKPKPFCNI
jgi:Ras-related protein Rab-23